LTEKKLRGAWPTLDAFTTALGDVSLYHQGRKIETLRINNDADGYAINGWEAESVENHSGIVDCWRNPKGDPAILAYYNQPLYVAVKTRSQFAEIPGEVAVDFYVINEKDLHGDYTLKISASSPRGKKVFAKEIPVKLTGGEVYGELLTADVTVPIAGATGMFRIEAQLQDANRKTVTTGRDDVLAVDWKSQKLGGKGATWEGLPQVASFLKTEKGLAPEVYRDDLGKLDWVIVTRPPNESEPVEIPAASFSSLTASFVSNESFRNVIHQRAERNLDFYVPDGAAPDPQVSTMENYGVRWEGQLTPTVSGNYEFATESNDGVRLWVDGKLLFDDLTARSRTVNRGSIALEAGKPVTVRLDFWHRKGEARCRLLWAPPEVGGPSAAKLIERVRNDGTTLVILDRADTWMPLITNSTPVKYSGSFQIGTAWLGGLHFVREHPLFKDLPVNVAMDWPYQAVVRNGKTRSGLLLDGEELVAGCWHSYPMNLGTAVGIIPCGKGKIIVSTLDIASQLKSTDTSAEVARKLLCNFVEYAGRK
jgi:beta-galactosidase